MGKVYALACLVFLAWKSALGQMDQEKNKIFYDTEDKISDEKSSGGVESLYKYNPGIRVRLAKGLIDMVHENLLEYGNTYLNFDYAFQKAGEYKFNHFPLFVHFKYSNLRHDPISFNMTNAALQFLSSGVSDDE
jgi:hypothetical protein